MVVLAGCPSRHEPARSQGLPIPASADNGPVVHCSPPLPALRRPVHRPWRVPPTAYLGGGFWLFISDGARRTGSAPTAGVRPGGALTARPPRSAGRGPRERRPGPPTSSARAAAARAPLLARLGVLACEAVFPSPVVLRRLAAPCVLQCSLPCF